MSNRLTSEKWLREHDPRQRQKDYDDWREQHRKYLLMRAGAHLRAISGGAANVNAPATLIASVTGLSPSTVTRYVKKQNLGRRGPLLVTYLALAALAKKV